MLSGNIAVAGGIGLRPARPSDQPFIQVLYASTRDDLRQIDGEQDFIANIVDMQYRTQTVGYGAQFPNAMYFIIERLGERIGRITLDFGSNEVRLVDIAFVPEARGKGYGEHVLRAIQQTAAKIMAPVTLSVLKSNLPAKRLYLCLGFQVELQGAMHDRMIWYPDANTKA